jgi:hypothetical protein
MRKIFRCLLMIKMWKPFHSSETYGPNLLMPLFSQTIPSTKNIYVFILPLLQLQFQTFYIPILATNVAILIILFLRFPKEKI